MSEEQQQEETKKPRGPKKGSIPRTELDALTGDIPTWDKASFHMVGPRDGIRLAVPRTRGISRAYFYGADDYRTIPDHPAIRVFQPDERRERKLGGIMAELDLSHGLELAREALGLLVQAVRSAPVDVGESPAEPSPEPTEG